MPKIKARRDAIASLFKAPGGGWRGEVRMSSTAFLSKRQKLRLLLGAVIGIALGASIWFRHAQAPAAMAKAPPLIPAQTAVVQHADVPIYLQGLGTVQAFNTVMVTTRVDGQLIRVNFVEGQEVKTGDVLAQIDPHPYQAALDQATATKAKDEAQLRDDQLNLQRDIALAQQNYTSKRTLDAQSALVAQLEAQVKVDQAQIDSAKTNLDYTTIHSPFDGRTGIRRVDPGNNLLTSAATTIVAVTQMRPISAIFTLPEDDFSAVSKGMAEGALTAIALSHDNKTELDRGTVAVLDNEINQASGTLKLKATFPNATEALWPGEFVNINLLVRTEKNVLTIPATAVQRGPDGLYAYVVKPDMSVAIRPISLEQFESGRAIIERGLLPGEHVVTAGQYRLQPGAYVQSSGDELAQASAGQHSGARQTP